MARRRGARRFVFAIAALLLVAAVVEFASAAAFTLATGRLFSPARAAELRAAARATMRPETVVTPGDDPMAAAAAALLATLAQHPFLGFVYDPTQPSGVPISSFGFVGRESPVRARSPDRFVVGLVGGSVAMSLGVMAESALAAALQRSPSIAGRRVEIVNLAIGGYKQPQQLLLVELLFALGGAFDCVVALDGYNEVALLDENLPLGVPAWYPRSWARLLDDRPTTDQLLRLGRYELLRTERSAAAAAAEAVAWSPTWQFVWWWRDGRFARDLAVLRAEIERAAPQSAWGSRGPGTEGVTADAARTEMVALWARASRQLHAACVARGVRYCHFLQPNQYVPGSKPIGADEAKVALLPEEARNRTIGPAYAQLREAGSHLRAAGVPFFDLTGIFANHPEPLYIDTCCHLGLAGNRILAEHVAAGVRAQFETAPGDVRALVVEPNALAIDSPMAWSRLRVFAVDASGRRFEVSGLASGVQLHDEPAGSLRVAPDGSVQAMRTGVGTLRVRLGELETTVPFTAAWPEPFHGADARPDADGSVPTVAVARTSGATLQIRCDALHGPAIWMLVVGRRPLPESLDEADFAGLSITPLTVTETSAVANVAVPPATDGPVFVRVYGIAPAGRHVVAASATTVLAAP